MNRNICLLLNGQDKWYKNIIRAFERHGGTWVQQSQELKSEHTQAFLEIIDRYGFFLAFGYVQRPVSAIGYLFKIDEMRSGYERIPPPDDTVPPFDPAYDIKQGKCKDADDFKYQTWLYVMSYESLEPPIELSRFRKLTDDKPYKLLYGRAHYYSTTPEAYRMKEESSLEARPNIPRPIDSSAVETPPKAELSSIKQLELEPEYPLSQCETDTGFAESILARWVRVIKRKKQAIFYGPPGTGKTYIARHLACHLIGGSDGFYDLVQFHPAYAYEDFVQGIRPGTNNLGVLCYSLVPGRFLEFCNKAVGRQGPCVLIIDEINRANLSRVFGELMYLMEYRDRVF